MLKEAIEALNISPKKWYLDATFGRGGHTREIINAGGNVIAFDQDLEAIEYGKDEFALEIEEKRLFLIHSNFDQLKNQLSQLRLEDQAETATISGVLFDFGTSQDQIRAPHRGFSFDHPDAPLDMRMDQELGVTAADLLSILSKKQLESLFAEFGGETRSNSHKIASAIDKYRKPDRSKRVETVGELRNLIEKIVHRHSHLHPATKVFQALRIAVNSELDCIKEALPQALESLEAGGRIVTIAFHQGEDSIAKHTLNEWEENNLGKNLFDKPLKPSETEVNNNPSARSAKLRAFEKR